MRVFGLIGYPLGHSFSRKYFSEKFVREGITDAIYELFPLDAIQQFTELVEQTNGLEGLNVTIPYKEQIIPLLDSLTPEAQRIGAVNVVKINADKTTTGYNSDYFGFRTTLEGWLQKAGIQTSTLQALVLGTGGASKAVRIVLEDMGIAYRLVSRRGKDQVLGYADLTAEIMVAHSLIINTTPLGMYPNVDQAPPIPYTHLLPSHFLYDLVYNPEKTLFLQQGEAQGAQVFGGLPMLYGQAEKSWEIWNS